MGILLLSGAVRVNSSLLALLDRTLKPSHHLGLSIREAAALKGSLRAQSEALSHSMWVLSGLLAFVRLQRFAPEDAVLFNSLVTSLSKSLAHQANLTATHTAFLGLKWRQFFLSHLPSYFSDVAKRSMLSSPVVLASSFFAEGDVARLFAETQTSPLSGRSRLLWRWLPGVSVATSVALVLLALLPGRLLLLLVAVTLGHLLRLRSVCALTCLLLRLLCVGVRRVFASRGYVFRPP